MSKDKGKHHLGQSTTEKDEAITGYDFLTVPSSNREPFIKPDYVESPDSPGAAELYKRVQGYPKKKANSSPVYCPPCSSCPSESRRKAGAAV